MRQLFSNPAFCRGDTPAGHAAPPIKLAADMVAKPRLVIAAHAPGVDAATDQQDHPIRGGFAQIKGAGRTVFAAGPEYRRHPASAPHAPVPKSAISPVQTAILRPKGCATDQARAAPCGLCRAHQGQERDGFPAPSRACPTAAGNPAPPPSMTGRKAPRPVRRQSLRECHRARGSGSAPRCMP